MYNNTSLFYFIAMRSLYVITALMLVSILTSCELAGDIFEAGAYTGIFIVIVIIALVIWVISRFRK